MGSRANHRNLIIRSVPMVGTVIERDPGLKDIWAPSLASGWGFWPIIFSMKYFGATDVLACRTGGLHSRPQSSSLLRMTDDEKSSGEPWTKLFRYLLLVETKKARLIGQSATRWNLNVPCEGRIALLGILCLFFMQITDRACNRKMCRFRRFLVLKRLQKSRIFLHSSL